MATKCKKCNGIIPDVMFDGKDRCDCKYHKQPEINWPPVNFCWNKN